MPTYLCHGFRWHRPSIRVFVIVQDLEDASPDWVVRPATTRSLLDAFGRLFDFLPTQDLETDAEAEAAAVVAAAAAAAQKAAEATAAAAASASEQRGRRQSISQAARAKSKSRKDKKDKEKAAKVKEKNDAAGTPGAAGAAPLSGPTPVAGVTRRNDGRDEVLARQDRSPIKLLEEHDTQRLDEMSRPHAYVADYVARIDLSASIVDEMARYERLQQQRWRREQKTKDGFPSMAGPSEEGASLGAALGAGEGSGGGSGATLTKRKKGSGWLEQLRDQLQRGEDIRWYVVVNDDEDRAYPGEVEGEETDDETEENVLAAEAQAEAQAKTETTRQERLRTEEDEILPERRQPSSFGDFMDEHGFGDSIATASSPPVSNRYLEREREREKERQRQRLRFELTGDPNILEKWNIPSPTSATAPRASYRPGPGKPTITPSSSAASTAAPMVFSLSRKPSTASQQAQQAQQAQHNQQQQQQQQQQQHHQQNGRRDRSSTITSSLNSNNIGDDFAFPQPPPMVPSLRGPQQPQLQPQPQPQPHAHLHPQPPSSPPPMPPLSPPTLRPKKSGDLSGLRPKTPNGRSSGGASGFRRLFGRSSKTAVNEAANPS
ncbi:uncharacterized protein SPSK_08923 [Sporothrix schenckii 1099-18]|uniref:Uncharacterized protein n=1 Tax=Sporothrix schenckii 1099-18 TaxID=1397361 RepID=A0A0F2MC02_SPOSC|nr:uncharacterized protein SPSK_08923 [Sporothrix schenckii 1099-18]KJR85686.1 hypothetical protein SPSK_08923 [Sporothrix schenckii 1099-18]